MRPGQSTRTLEALQRFYAESLDAHMARSLSMDAGSGAVALFLEVARDVPAYKLFLERAGFDATKVRSGADFPRVPITTKENYHEPYSLPQRCRGGALDACDFVAVSSGSTGQPTVWPRFVTDEIGTTWRFEQVLRDAFRAQERRTLGVVCFALGSWVGGMFTVACCRHLAAKGYPLTLATPGNNREEIVRVVRELGPLYDQVVLFGYPPFLKDAIDSGASEGLDWSAYNVRLVLAGEVYSEEWRDVVCRRLGWDGSADARHPALATASLYGTADGGVLGNETPLSIVIRRFLAAHPEAAHALFGDSRLPTLCQYDPTHRYFELEGDSLLFSGDGGVPLLRYKMFDQGGIIGYAEMLERLGSFGYSPAEELAILTGGGFLAAPASRARELPFVYVFGRSSFAISFYGANVYPENVAAALELPHVESSVTGKFVMEVVEDESDGVLLQVTVELAGAEQGGGDVFWEMEFTSVLEHSVRMELERLNSEFANYVPPEKRTPRVRFRPLGDPEYFPVGVKHRYTRG